MKRVAVPLTITLLLLFSAPASVFVLPSSQAQATTLLSVDFTGKTLPAGWILQGSAAFIGGLNTSSGVGGVQLTNGDNQEGAVIYDAPFTAENIIIEFSGMYAVGGGYGTDTDDIGVGFYSGGPSTNTGPTNPASPNGYYAGYTFYYHDYGSALKYNGNPVSTGGTLPSSGRNYLFTETVVTPSSISMNAITTTGRPFTQAISITLTNMLSYNNATGIDNSHSTLYTGASTGCVCSAWTGEWSYTYVYWLRILPYSTSATTTAASTPTSVITSGSVSSSVSTSQPATQFVTQTVTSTQPPVTQSVTQPLATSSVASITVTIAPPPTGSNDILLLTYLGIAIGVIGILVPVFLARRDRQKTSRLVATKLCKSCGSQLKKTDRFCDKCGASQAET
jgi:hypothetical protein